ncbi:MAG: TonB-dependent receptor plug domain-containing protein, partial [Luteitalea sp.]|nr:TonB-dependent receptor plug domain-containing protein [Luteitalea sp.]
MKSVWCALACLGMHLALAVTTVAQVGTETSISGVITDSSGAVVPGASVAVVQLETGLARTAESDTRGSFEIWALPIGPYEVTVAASGFNAWKAERIVLTVGERRRLFPMLSISKLTQEVTVVGGAAESLQTDNSAVQTVVQMHQIRELPLRTRNPVALVGLVPGMRFITSDSGAERNAYVQGLGARSNATGFQIDGANANSGMDEGAMGVSNVETIAEFSVQTSSFDASSGRSPIQVVMASRSGTNDIHGTVWEFFQDDALNARNAFATEDPPEFERHEVGASLGGPIVRDRLFFFGSGQARPLTDFRVYNQTVPTPSMFQGDFSHLGSPIIDPTTGEPFPGNRIPADRISPASRFFEPHFL